MQKTAPADAKGIVQAHVLQTLKRHFGSKLQAGSLLGYGGCSFVPVHV